MPVIRVITAVSYDHSGQYVLRVRWGLADTDTNRWKTRPAESHVIHVLEALKYGEDVWTVFSDGDKVSVGPRVHAVKIRPGLKSIETVETDPAHSLGQIARF